MVIDRGFDRDVAAETERSSFLKIEVKSLRTFLALDRRFQRIPRIIPLDIIY